MYEHNGSRAKLTGFLMMWLIYCFHVCVVSFSNVMICAHLMAGKRVGCLAFSLFEPPHDKTNKMTCAPSEDSDQPGHSPSLIRVFAVRMKKA